MHHKEKQVRRHRRWWRARPAEDDAHTGEQTRYGGPTNMVAAAAAGRISRPDQGPASSQARAALNQTVLEDN